MDKTCHNSGSICWQYDEVGQIYMYLRNYGVFMFSRTLA